jgi:metallo-beta-lactamase class B VIM
MKTWLKTLLIVPFLSACDSAFLDNFKSSDATPSEPTPSFAQTNFPVTLTKIAEGVWVHTSNYRLPAQPPIPSNGLIVEDGDGLIVVDTPWGEMATQSLIETIAEDIGKPVTKVIVTHHHPDRLAGIDVMEAHGIESYSHPDTGRLAAQNGFPVPNRAVAELKAPGARVKVGSVEVSYPGPGHAQDNIIVYVPSADILFGGCAIKSAGSKSLGNTGSADVDAWPKSLEWLKATYPNTKLIVPGHGKGAGLALIDETLALLSAETAASENATE